MIQGLDPTKISDFSLKIACYLKDNSPESYTGNNHHHVFNLPDPDGRRVHLRFTDNSENDEPSKLETIVYPVRYDQFGFKAVEHDFSGQLHHIDTYLGYLPLSVLHDQDCSEHQQQYRMVIHEIYKELIMKQEHQECDLLSPSESSG